MLLPQLCIVAGEEQEDGHERGLTNGHQGVARGREVTTHIGWGIPPISWEGATVFENERVLHGLELG